jgi:hypothetical protein
MYVLLKVANASKYKEAERAYMRLDIGNVDTTAEALRNRHALANDVVCGYF